MRTHTATLTQGNLIGRGGAGPLGAVSVLEARLRVRGELDRQAALAERLRAGLAASPGSRNVAVSGLRGVASPGSRQRVSPLLALLGQGINRRAGGELPGGVFGASLRAAAAAGVRGGGGGGGGGGGAPQCYNLRELMNCCVPAAQEATADLDDRAHQDRDAGGLVPARMARAARPRRYHPSQMVGPEGARVGVDTAAERLDRAMWTLGMGGAPSMAAAVREGLAAAAAVSASRGGPRSPRGLIERRTRMEMSPEELALEERGSAMLRRAGVAGVRGSVGVGVGVGVGGGHG